MRIVFRSKKNPVCSKQLVWVKPNLQNYLLLPNCMDWASPTYNLFPSNLDFFGSVETAPGAEVQH